MIKIANREGKPVRMTWQDGEEILVNPGSTQADAEAIYADWARRADQKYAEHLRNQGLDPADFPEDFED